jgi:hypothetical protein
MMGEAIIETIVHLAFATGGTTLLWIAFDWKVAIGALLLSIYARSGG